MAPGMHSRINALVFDFVKCDALRWFYYNLLYVVLSYVDIWNDFILKILCMATCNVCFVIIFYLVFGNCDVCPA